MPIALILALLIGGGVSVAANGALPGEALYPIKVGMNEEVEAFFAFTSESKARVAADHMQERFEEAARLAVEATVEAEAEAEFEASLDEAVTEVRGGLDDLRAKGHTRAVAEVSSEVEGDLQAHANILLELRARGVSGAAIDKALTQIQAVLGAIIESRVRAEADFTANAEVDVDVQAAAEGRLRAAKNKIAEVKQRFENTKAKLSAQVKAQVEAKIAASEAAAAEAQAKVDASVFGEAFVAAQRAHRLAQEAQILINLSLDLEVEIEIEDGILNIEVESEDEADRRGDGTVDDNDNRGGGDDEAEVEVEGEINVQGGSNGNSGSGNVSGGLNINL